MLFLFGLALALLASLLFLTLSFAFSFVFLLFSAPLTLLTQKISHATSTFFRPQRLVSSDF